MIEQVFKIVIIPLTYVNLCYFYLSNLFTLYCAWYRASYFPRAVNTLNTDQLVRMFQMIFRCCEIHTVYNCVQIEKKIPTVIIIAVIIYCKGKRVKYRLHQSLRSCVFIYFISCFFFCVLLYTTHILYSQKNNIYFIQIFL